MKNLTSCVLWGGVLTLVVGYCLLPNVQERGLSLVFTKATANTRAVASAARLYAEDHEGRLPQSLQQLVPRYLSEAHPLDDLNLTTPSAMLAELSPDAFMIFSAVTDVRRSETRIIFARPDGSTELLRP